MVFHILVFPFQGSLTIQILILGIRQYTHDDSDITIAPLPSLADAVYYSQNSILAGSTELDIVVTSPLIAENTLSCSFCYRVFFLYCVRYTSFTLEEISFGPVFRKFRSTSKPPI